MKCINEDILEAFIDNKLGDIEKENIIIHITECERCFSMVTNFADSEKRLIDTLARHVGIERVEKENGACLNKRLILGYVINSLEKEGMDYVENHLKDCNRCLVYMMEVQKRHLKEADLKLDSKTIIATKTNEFDPGKVIPTQNNLIISLMEDVGKKIYEVVECTGKILKGHFPAEAAVRGVVKTSKKNAIQIQKAFINKGLSIEVTITKGHSQHSCDVRLSLMKIKDEEIVGITEGYKVNIVGGNLSKDADSDKKGEVEFKNLPNGNYRIFINNGVEVIVYIGKKE